LAEGFAAILPYFQARMAKFQPNAGVHNFLDRIAREQTALGA
jgi:hypothetical protein